MFKNLFSRNNKASEIALLFDIGSDSIAGSVVHFSGISGVAPRIIHTKRLHWKNDTQSSYDDLLRSMKYTLGNIARDIQDRDFPLGANTGIYVTLSAPWFAHDIRRAELSRGTVFTINQKTLEGIKQREMSAFYKESAEIYGEDFKLIEETIIDISVNGYTTANPIGQKTKHIDLSIYVSVSPKEVLSVIEDTLGRVFHHNIEFQTSTLVTYVVSRDFFAKEKDYIFIDIGGELTDILVVRNNTIFQTLSFPLGIQFFNNSIAKSLGSSPHEAHSILTLASKNALQKDYKEKVLNAKQKAYKAYEKHLEESLRQLAKKYKLPQEMYISGYSFFEEDLKKLLEQEHVGQYSMLEIPFEVEILNGPKFYSRLVYQPEVKRDLFIALSALYRSHI